MEDYGRFHKYAKEFLSCEKINIPSSFRLKVQDMVTKKLNLQNLNEVRDRFEGQAYLDKTMLSMASKYILKIYLTNELILDIDNINNTIKQNIMSIDETVYQLVPFYFGTLPKLHTPSNLPLIFCSIRTDFRNGSVFGYLDSYSMNDKDLFLLNSSGLMPNYEFIGFKKLKKLTINKQAEK